jgi:diguanylate cyclase (GGDEF)-like protein/PAS domain S-box-containing protein
MAAIRGPLRVPPEAHALPPEEGLRIISELAAGHPPPESPGPGPDLGALAFERAAAALAVLTSDHRICTANAAFAGLAGRPACELRGARFAELLWAEGRPFEDGRREVRLLRRDGSLRWIGLSLTPLGVAGGAGAWVAVLEDIEESKRAEEKLTRWEEAADLLPAAIWMEDAQDRNIGSNRTWSKITGRSQQDSRGTGWFEAIHPEDRAAVAQVNSLPPAERPAEVECRLLRPDGAVRWMLMRQAAHFTGTGEYAGRAGICLDITDRKRGEDRISKLLRAVEQSPVTVVITDPAGTIEYVNPCFTQITGYSGEEAIGQNPRILKSGQTPAGEYRRLWETIPTGEWRGEFLNRKKNGELYWEAASISPLRDAHGRVTNYVAVKEDITARKRIEEELRRSEERFRRTFEDAPIGMSLVSLDRGTYQANGALRRMLGYTGEELARLSVADRTHPEDYAVEADLLAAAWRGEVPSYQIEKRYVRKDGTIVWGRVSASFLVSSTGDVHAIGMVEDITARKSAEEALRLSEERLKLALEASTDGLWDWNLATRETYFSSRVATTLGHDPAAFNLTWEGWERLVHPDDFPRVMRVALDHIEGRNPLYQCEYRVAGQSGEWIWVLCRGKVVERDSEGRAVRMSGTFTDVTRRREAEEALRVSEERFRVAAGNSGALVFEWDTVSGEIEIFDAAGAGGDTAVRTTVEAWQPRVHPKDRDRIAECLERYLRTEGRFEEDVAVTLEGGSERHYLVRGAPSGGAGGPGLCIGTILDVTERRRAEEAVARMAAVVQYSDDAIVSVDLDGRIQSWNSGAQKLLGYQAAEATGRMATLLVPERERAWMIGLHRTAASGRAVKNVEATHVRKDGTEVPVSLTLSPIQNSSGELLGIAQIAQDISVRKRAQEDLAYLAYHDPLTGLPNRRFFNERLEHAIAAGPSALALLFVDLDGFKLVNDTLGHSSGDILLRDVASRLAAALEGSDVLARTGGDEFSVILGGQTHAAAAELAAARILEALKEPFRFVGRDLFVAASIGIALYPHHGKDWGTLQKNADSAMYEAKRRGKGRLHFFTPDLSAFAKDRLELESQLREALRRNELEVRYQPLFRLRDLRVSGAEALARWNHPERGCLLPGSFIPIAEETGLIVPIGDWVLRRACQLFRDWLSRGMSAGRMAVNVSARQFARPDFPGAVAAALAATGLEPGFLELEITETAVMQHFDDSAPKIGRLRSLGVSISLDDFGTGYSSLSYLQRLPVTTVKLDKSFLWDIETSASAVALIRGVIVLAHDLGVRVVAEGVETSEQLEAVRGLGCDEVQGYLLGGVTAGADMPGVLGGDVRLPIPIPA